MGLFKRVSPYLALPLYPLYRGAGVIISLHRILNASSQAKCSANRALEITQEYLERLLRTACSTGYEPIKLGTIPERLASNSKSKFFALTFDDGYRDNLEFALPLLERYEVPATIFLTTSLLEPGGMPWWYILESCLWKCDSLVLRNDEHEHSLFLQSQRDKEEAFVDIARTLKSASIARREFIVRDLCRQAEVDPEAVRTSIMLSWEEISTSLPHPLIDIGSHGVNHLALAKLDMEEAAGELRNSRNIIKERLHIDVEAIAYPYGGRDAVGLRDFALAKDAGYYLGVTTRGANIFPAHSEHLLALPRGAPSGNYQQAWRIPWLLRGTTRAHENGWRPFVTS